MNRDQKFGRLLAIANVLGNRVFENDRISISDKYLGHFEKNPVKAFEQIHKELMEYAPKFKEDELQLMDMFGEILAGMSETEFNNERLGSKYLHAYYSQQHALNNMIGVEEAAEILNLSPGTVKNYCAEGKIEAKKIGKTWVIDKTKLDKGMAKMQNFKVVGTWWNDKGIDLVEIDGTVYALNGWNGESFIKSWECTGEDLMDASDREYKITPITEEIDGDFEVTGYEVQ